MEKQTLGDALRVATLALLDKQRGYGDEDIVALDGSMGLDRLIGQLIALLDEAGHLPEDTREELGMPALGAEEMTQRRQRRAIADLHAEKVGLQDALLSYTDMDEAAQCIYRDQADVLCHRIDQACDLEVQVDDRATVLPARSGAFVSAWLYVDGETIPDKDRPVALPWVIYHPKEDQEARFWSDEDGWTDLDGATRYASEPARPLPLGGPDNTEAQPLCIGTMRLFRLEAVPRSDPYATPDVFECFAEDLEHAMDQAENFYTDQDMAISEALEDV